MTLADIFLSNDPRIIAAAWVAIGAVGAAIMLAYEDLMNPGHYEPPLAFGIAWIVVHLLTGPAGFIATVASIARDIIPAGWEAVRARRNR